ncbi:tRNA (adenosine(37)-N6)-dimethylallyltransferase MiaA [Gynuella sp.]|uniref:tRNA (adenosine(37)-N6)-dimethylallyltransferase MiaA n=1 Tax=Gynuella sp. TaxID=2969146 RepID=UPI003D10EEB0
MLPVIFLMGPTASGKTDLAIELVQQFNCEIISVDSALIYRDMNIGTAKPTAAELALAPHHLIDIIEPHESYSVANFRQDALSIIDDIQFRGKVPLLVGGTMLYFKALLEGLADNLPQASADLRRELEHQLQTEGLAALTQRLKALDNEAAKRIHLDNPQRVIRALEVILSTGKSITWFWEQQKHQPEPFPYPTIQLAVAPQERKALHSRIEQRFSKMIKNGFEQEVVKLRQRKNLNLDLPSMRCVGYRQMWQYLDGTLSYEVMIEKGIIATRQLAKRQLTWLRGWQGLEWFDSDHTALPAQVKDFLLNKAFFC